MMKKTAFLIAMLTLLALCCFCAAAADEEEPVVLDHVVYAKCVSSDRPPFYYVASLFDTEKAKRTQKTVTIRPEVNGLPVKWIMTVRGEIERDDPSSVDDWVPLIPDRFINPEGAACETVVLPSTLEFIGGSAFYAMTNLKKINLPQGLEVIGAYAFERCYALEKIRIPGSVGSIRTGAFYDCGALRTVILEEGVRHIEMDTFCGCTSLEKLRLPSSMRTMGKGVFRQTSLRSITIPAACRTASFEDVPLLRRVTFTDRKGDFRINARAFLDCPSLESVRLPKSAAVTVGAYAFARCENLKKIYNGSAIVSISKNAFLSDHSLPALTLSGKLSSVAKTAFCGCDGLKKLRFPGADAAFLSADAGFLQTLPSACRIYVKTEPMRQAFLDAGCKNKVFVKADLA